MSSAPKYSDRKDYEAEVQAARSLSQSIPDWETWKAARDAENTEYGDPPFLDIDPATITRIDAKEDVDPDTGTVMDRLTLGTAPDGTAVVILESTYDDERGTWEDAESGALRTELQIKCVWGYPSLEAARQHRDQQMEQA